MRLLGAHENRRQVLHGLEVLTQDARSAAKHSGLTRRRRIGGGYRGGGQAGLPTCKPVWTHTHGRALSVACEHGAALSQFCSARAPRALASPRPLSEGRVSPTALPVPGFAVLGSFRALPLRESSVTGTRLTENSHCPHPGTCLWSTSPVPPRRMIGVNLLGWVPVS